MSFDINSVVADMTAAVTNIAKEEGGDVSDSAKRILDAEKESLKELSEARLKGEIDDTIFERELEREKKVVEAELLTITIMTKAMAQKAVNAALDIFVKAVKIAI